MPDPRPSPPRRSNPRGIWSDRGGALVSYLLVTGAVAIACVATVGRFNSSSEAAIQAHTEIASRLLTGAEPVATLAAEVGEAVAEDTATGAISGAPFGGGRRPRSTVAEAPSRQGAFKSRGIADSCGSPSCSRSPDRSRSPVGRRNEALALDHRPTSGVRIPANVRPGSYIIGRFGSDMGAIVGELGYPAETRADRTFTLPPGQRFQILNVTWEETGYWKTKPGRFFRNVNAPWIDSAVERNADIYVVSSVNRGNLYVTKPDGKGGLVTALTSFGEEIHRLEWKWGYRYDPRTHTMVPPSRAGNLPRLTDRGNIDIDYPPDPDDRE